MLIDSAKHFNICPYTFTPWVMAEDKLYADLGGQNVVILTDEISTNVLTWLTIISPTLPPFITEPGVGRISYNPRE